MLDYWREEILGRSKKRVSFYEYMSACLYHPQYGYYMRENDKIGKQGDFYTSSSVHSVFAETIVGVAVDVFKQQESPIQFCEMGAGTGRFAKQFLDALAHKYPQEYKAARYILVEKSDFHRRRQEVELQEHHARIEWSADLSSIASFSGIFFTNELVDSFPVHLVEKRNGQLWEVGVTWAEEEKSLREIMYPLLDGNVKQYLQEYGFELAEGQRLEVPTDAVEWMKEVDHWLAEGLWLTIDYGYTYAELMSPAHRRGSLVCYDQHHCDDNPYLKPGEKDLTYHIHFDVLQEVAHKRGWQCLGFYNQADFLLRAGILKLLEEHQEKDPFLDGAIKKNRAIRQFITPEGISGSFQVLALAKGKYARPPKEYSFTQPFKIETLLS